MQSCSILRTRHTWHANLTARCGRKHMSGVFAALAFRRAGGRHLQLDDEQDLPRSRNRGARRSRGGDVSHQRVGHRPPLLGAAAHAVVPAASQSLPLISMPSWISSKGLAEARLAPRVSSKARSSESPQVAARMDAGMQARRQADTHVVVEIPGGSPRALPRECLGCI